MTKYEIRLVWLSALIGGAIVIVGFTVGAMTMPAESATLEIIPGQCWTGGCGRAVV